MEVSQDVLDCPAFTIYNHRNDTLKIHGLTKRAEKACVDGKKTNYK